MSNLIQYMLFISFVLFFGYIFYLRLSLKNEGSSKRKSLVLCRLMIGVTAYGLIISILFWLARYSGWEDIMTSSFCPFWLNGQMFREVCDFRYESIGFVSFILLLTFRLLYRLLKKNRSDAYP